MRWIYLGRNWFTCVDDEDYEQVSSVTWKIDKKGYARKRKGPFVFLHNFILNHSSVLEPIDHLNRAKWDNRKQNLKIVSKSHNNSNIGMPDNPPFPTEEEKQEAIKQRWCLIQNNNNKRKLKTNKPAINCKSVKNITTGEIFTSIKLASERYCISAKNINSCVKGKRNRCGGYVWRYLDDPSI